MPTPTDFLEAIKKRGIPKTGRGIGLASSYVKTLATCADDKKMLAKYFKMAGTTSWDDTIKSSDNVLVYRDEGMGVFGGFFGEAQKKFGEIQSLPYTKGACLDFGCVLTSKAKDRDGDILDPTGAELDPMMPLLWQHIPVEPCGKMVSVLDRNDYQVRTHFAIVDTELGRDAAQLVEFGALRVSHGFQPIKFKAFDEGGIEFNPDPLNSGWMVHKFFVMEGSLVSIPSNTDCVIQCYSREKLHHPMVKMWAGKLYEGRPAQSNGWTPPDIHVHVNISDGKVVEKSVALATKYITEDNGKFQVRAESTGAILGEHDTRADAEKQLAAIEISKHNQDKGAETPVVKGVVESAMGGAQLNEPKDITPEQVLNANASPPTVEDPVADQSPPKVLLSEIMALVAKLTEDASLPPEAKSRAATVSGLLTTIQGAMEAFTAAMGKAASSEDVTGMFDDMEDFFVGVVSSLSSVADEVMRLGNVDGVGENSIEAAKKIIEQIKVVAETLGSFANSVQNVNAESPPGAENPMSTSDEEAAIDGALRDETDYATPGDNSSMMQTGKDYDLAIARALEPNYDDIIAKALDNGALVAPGMVAGGPQRVIAPSQPMSQTSGPSNAPSAHVNNTLPGLIAPNKPAGESPGPDNHGLIAPGIHGGPQGYDPAYAAAIAAALKDGLPTGQGGELSVSPNPKEGRWRRNEAGLLQYLDDFGMWTDANIEDDGSTPPEIPLGAYNGEPKDFNVLAKKLTEQLQHGAYIDDSLLVSIQEALNQRLVA